MKPIRVALNIYDALRRFLIARHGDHRANKFPIVSSRKEGKREKDQRLIDASLIGSSSRVNSEIIDSSHAWLSWKSPLLVLFQTIKPRRNGLKIICRFVCVELTPWMRISDCTKLQGITANHISGKKNVIFVVCSRSVAYESTENARRNRIWWNREKAREFLEKFAD